MAYRRRFPFQCRSALRGVLRCRCALAVATLLGGVSGTAQSPPSSLPVRHHAPLFPAASATPDTRTAVTVSSPVAPQSAQVARGDADEPLPSWLRESVSAVSHQAPTEPGSPEVSYAGGAGRDETAGSNEVPRPRRITVSQVPAASGVFRSTAEPTISMASPEPLAGMTAGMIDELPSDELPSSVGSSAMIAGGTPVVAPLGIMESRPRIVFQPAVPTRDATGMNVLRPTVQLADDPGTQILASPDTITNLVPRPRSVVPQPAPTTSLFSWGQDLIPDSVGDRFGNFRENRPTPFANLFQNTRSALRSQRGRDLGIGVERLPFALFEIDVSQPSNNVRVRFEAGYDWEFPDRAEFFWSKLDGRGPPKPTPFSEPSVDYQDLRFAFEVGGERFSATTDIPLRFVNPTILGNTGSLGDIVLTTRTVMIDGDTWQLTQILRNQMPTGTASTGRGNGHVSMEPGLVARYSWSERTQIHNELKLWFPLGSDPSFSGPILRYGFGWANVLYEDDLFAVLPTLEVVGWSVLSGQKTGLLGNAIDIDGENILNLYPGVRLVRESSSGGNLFEIGLNAGLAVSESHWYRSMLRMDLRWTF